jgi:hypothetical protein
MANEDIRVKNTMPVADWSSEIVQTGQSSASSTTKSCFSLNLTLRSYISSVSVVLIHQNSSSPQTIQSRNLMQLYVDEWTSEADKELIKEVNDSFEVPLAGVLQYQVSLADISA